MLLLKAHQNAKAWKIIAQYYRYAVQLGDRPNHAEAQAVARCGSAFLKAVETAEDIIVFFRRDARTIIGDQQQNTAFNGRKCNLDLGA